MRKIFSIILLLGVYNSSQAQNVGIGTTEPLNKIHIAGNFLATSPTTATNTAPTAAQTKNIINANTITPPVNDSTLRIFDPGGPSGNYTPNTAGNVYINGLTLSAVEMTIETIDLGTGDSLIIKESPAPNATVFLAVGNGYYTTGKWIFSYPNVYIMFKSNADANVGAGFSLLIRKLYDASSNLPDIGGVTGKGFYFDTKKGAIRSGTISNNPVGNYSVAMGNYARASGPYAVAFGNNSNAAGTNSLSMGSFTNAEGTASFAGGYLTEATRNYSMAFGYGSSASGEVSNALGEGTVASGNYSLATGYYSQATGNTATAIGATVEAGGSYSSSFGLGTISRGYAGTVIGMYNNPIYASGQTSATTLTPLLTVGNGDNSSNRSNALIVLKNGNVGIGKDVPAANLHIVHAGGGGLILENANNNNKWRLYSASGDNNLSFYNNAGTEIADIDDVTGTYSALSDSRFKKNILSMAAVLPSLMKLNPSYYQFNWQKPGDQRQIGMLAQEAYPFFPELVSYDKEKDLYKMNYAGFSVVAIKAIQEQEKEIEELKIRLEKLEAVLKSK